jgi:molybdopterin-synthase adenylyltransferase
VIHSDHQEDGQAGAAGRVHHEDLLTQRSRPGPDAGRAGADIRPTEGTAVQRPRIKRTTDAVRSAAGDVYVLRPGADADLVIERPDRATLDLLDALDGRRSAAELERDFGTVAVRRAIHSLSAAGLLEDAADDDRLSPRDRTRFDRQLRYFGDLASGGTPVSEYQRRLAEARVAMLGVGGLGTWASYALACCGAGELVLVDGDRVEESNFNRQVLFRERDLGRVKAEAAAEALAAFNSACRVTVVPRRLESEAEVRDAIEGADFVVNGADWPAHDIERWVNAACFAAGVPSITMSHSPPVARVGPMYVPGRTGCFACQETTYRAEHPLYDELVEQRRGRPSPAAALGPVCAFVGGQVALETVHLLTGLVAPATLGRAYVYDLRTMGVTHEDVPRVAGCEVCGG